jgi:hypothetical protein
MISDREIAIAHMSLWDAEDLETVEIWKAHWEQHFDSMLTEKYSGDCTKEPWPCSRCSAEEAMRMVPVYKKLFYENDK